MDNTMFMAFATEEDDYNRRVQECVRDIQIGAVLEDALCYYDVEYEDVLDAMKYMI